MAILTPDDLAPFVRIEAAKAEAMIADAEATAAMVAPCITTPEFLADETRLAQVRAVLRGAVVRWHEAGTGAVVQESTGPFSRTVDTKTSRRGMFWPDEIKQLQALCAAFTGESGDRKAFAVDTVGGAGWGDHSPICNLVFGGSWCSCGSDLNRGDGPLWEGGLLS